MRFFSRLLRKFFVLQSGPAHRVVFYYAGEEPTFLDDAFVTLYRNGAVEIENRNERVTTHVQNLEIVWHGMGEGYGGRGLTLVKTESRI